MLKINSKLYRFSSNDNNTDFSNSKSDDEMEKLDLSSNERNNDFGNKKSDKKIETNG